MLCSEWSLVKHSEGQQTVIPLRCRCWTCPECAPLRKAKLVAEAKAGRPNLFITLTSRRRPGITAAGAARQLVKAWRRARLEHMKLHGYNYFPFLAVFEKTKAGWPHLHILAVCDWLDQRWLSRRMNELHGSPIVDVRRVRGRQKVAAYVSKYVSKDPTRFAGCKRYWRSLDYLSRRVQVHPAWRRWEPPWQIFKVEWKTYARRCEKAGDRVEWARSEAVITRARPP